MRQDGFLPEPGRLPDVRRVYLGRTRPSSVHAPDAVSAGLSVGQQGQDMQPVFDHV